MRQFLPIRSLAVLSTLVVLAACESAEDRAEGYLESALELLEAGDFDRAAIEFRNVFELVPGHREARTAYARAVLERGRLNAAYGEYLRLVEQYPDDLEGRRVLSEIAFLRGDWDEVERHSPIVIEKSMDDPRVQAIDIGLRYREASVAEDESARRDVLREAEALSADRPKNEILRRVLIDGYTRSADYPKVLALLDTLIEENPKDRVFYNQRLGILAQMNDQDGIEAQLLSMVERFKNDQNVKTTLIRFYMSRQETDKAEDFLRSFASPQDEDSSNFLSLIQFVSQTRGDEAAREEIERGIAESPNPEIYINMRAVFDFASGEQDKAIADLRAVLEGAEPSEKIRSVKVALSRMLTTTGNEVGARRLIEEVLSEDELHLDALKIQGAWLIEADQTDDAIANLRKALEVSPEDAQAMTLMAEAYTRAGSHELAQDFLALAVEASGNAPAETVRYANLLIAEGQFLPAEDILIPALRLAPQNTEILYALGRLYLGMEDDGRAEQVVSTLRGIDTEQSRQIAVGIEASLLSRSNGVSEAARFLEGVALAEDADVNAKLAVLRVRLASNDPDGALSYAKSLVEEEPDNTMYQYALAVTQAAIGDLDSAKTGYRNMVEEDPRRAGVWLQLSRVLRQSGEEDAAVRAIDDGLAAQPEAGNLLWAKASYLEQNNKIDEAIAIYETLYERNSNSLVIANNLASMLATYREDDASLERAYKVARRLRNAEVPQFQDTYGWIAFRRGDPQEALPYLESAAENLPGDPLVLYHLSRVYLELKRPQDAQKWLQRVVDTTSPADTRSQIEFARKELERLKTTPAE